MNSRSKQPSPRFASAHEASTTAWPSSRGKRVDVVAHSMGGLIARYALAQTERGHDGFPPYLLVEDVATLATPHGGARWYTSGCGRGQCIQMNAGLPFLVWLEQNGWEPDGRGGTDWSTFGSDDDNLVAADRAAGTARDRDPAHDYIGSCHKVWYRESANIEHSDFLHTVSKETSADVDRLAAGRAGGCETTRRTGRFGADLAVTFGTF